MTQERRAGFYPFFADWRSRPGRYEGWRDERRGNYPTEDQWRREYPERVEDVLLSDEDVVFPPWAIRLAQHGAVGLQGPILSDPRTGVRTHRYIKAWDIGRLHDAAVGTVLDWTKTPYQVVGYRRLVQQPFPVLQAAIEEMHALYPGPTYVEGNGPGLAVIENLRVPASPFTTTQASKFKAIAETKLGLERGWLKFPPIAQLIFELSGYMWDDKGLVQDSVMSLAIAVAVAGAPAEHHLTAAVAPSESRTAPLRAQAGPGRSAGSRWADLPGAQRPGRSGNIGPITRPDLL